MKKRDSNIFIPKAKIWLSEEPKIIKANVEKVISGNRFVTDTNQIVMIKQVDVPEENQRGFFQARKDLENILHKHTQVQIKPDSKTNDGTIIAKVETRSTDISEYMQNKGWSPKSKIESTPRSRNKLKWHDKFL